MNSNFYLKKIKVELFGHLSFTGEPEFKPGVNILIGKNGSGKTSILQAIESPVEERTAAVPFSEKQVEQNKNKETLRLTFQTESDETPISYVDQKWTNSHIIKGKIRFIVSNRTIKNELTQNPFTQIAEFNIPDPTHEINIADEFNKTIISELLELVKEFRSETGENITEEIESAYRQGLVDFDKDIQIDFDRPNPVFFVDHNGNEVDILNLSAGEKEYLYFYSYLRRIRDDENKVILIDEPELHLHGNQIRKLCELVEKLSEKNQVILATHSSELLHFFLRSANLVLLNKGELSNPSVNDDLRVIVDEVGMPIDPSFFTAHWVFAENEPTKKLKGENAPTTPKLLEWIFKKDISRRFWSFGESKVRAEAAIDVLENASTASEDILLSIIFDGDKFFDLSEEYPSAEKSFDSENIYCFPFWEIENILISPHLLDEIIAEEEGVVGSKVFWARIKENEEIKKSLLESFTKTYTRNLVRRSFNSKRFDRNSIAELQKLKEEISSVEVDEGAINQKFNEVLEEEDWKWIPGKEALGFLTETKSDYWECVRALVDEDKFIELVKRDDDTKALIETIEEKAT